MNVLICRSPRFLDSNQLCFKKLENIPFNTTGEAITLNSSSNDIDISMKDEWPNLIKSQNCGDSYA